MSVDLTKPLIEQPRPLPPMVEDTLDLMLNRTVELARDADSDPKYLEIQRAVMKKYIQGLLDGVRMGAELAAKAQK